MERPSRILFSNVRLTLLSVIASSALYAAITWFVQTTDTAIAKSDKGQPLDDLHKLDSSLALTILRLLQAALTLVSTSALSSSLELVQWCLCLRHDGMGYVLYLVLSPATGLIATSRILVSHYAGGLDRIWAFLKYALSHEV